MNSDELAKEMTRGKELFSETLRVTSDFLERFELLGASEINAFENKRQELLEALAGFHAELGQKLPGGEEGLPPAITRQLDEFRTLKEVFVQIILEKNSEIVKKATGSRERLRREIAVMCQGKQALRGYNRRKSPSPNCTDKTA